MVDRVRESFIPVAGTQTSLQTIKTSDEQGNKVHAEAVYMGGIADPSNTTTTLLGSGETYTGDFVRVH